MKKNEKKNCNNRKFAFPQITPDRHPPIIHEAIAFTAIAPLLNLNLNYEKLRNKYIKNFQ